LYSPATRLVKDYQLFVKDGAIFDKSLYKNALEKWLFIRIIKVVGGTLDKGCAWVCIVFNKSICNSINTWFNS